MKLVVPDYVSPSYFPAIAAHELGYFADEGLEVELSLHFPVTDAARALAAGEIDLIAGAAHAPGYAFPRWDGARILMALSHGMYWFLVVGVDHPVAVGDLSGVRGLRIGAAPGPDDGLRALLDLGGIRTDEVGIEPVPGSSTHGTSFGLAAAEALAESRVDGFWANGMGAAVATAAGTGTVVYDARRDHLVPDGSLLTFPALTARAELVEREPERARAAVRAVRRAQRDLVADPGLATKVAEPVYPAYEASLIASLIERDAPFYDASVTPEMLRGLGLLARLTGRLDAPGPEVVAEELADLWG